MAKKPVVYFGTDVTKKYEIDSEQWFEHKKMNEGQKRQYESHINTEYKMNQSTQEMTMNMKVAAERKELFDVAIISYKVLWGNDKTFKEGRKINGVWDNQTQWENIRDDMPSDMALEIQKDIMDLNNLMDKKK